MVHDTVLIYYFYAVYRELKFQQCPTADEMLIHCIAFCILSFGQGMFSRFQYVSLENLLETLKDRS